MMERAADAWDHNQFKEVIVKAANVEMLVLPDLLTTRRQFTDNCEQLLQGPQLLPPGTTTAAHRSPHRPYAPNRPHPCCQDVPS